MRFEIRTPLTKLHWCAVHETPADFILLADDKSLMFHVDGEATNEVGLCTDCLGEIVKAGADALRELYGEDFNEFISTL